ncbi:MAG: winged helix-turn-helix transcriptional regulator [Candidatus Omnitrophica bacterium]|nr:winged helix-turn-helix transcriptional regulator [Candidatus Omnitrophota bacterium]
MRSNDEMMQIVAQRFKVMSEPLRLKILQLLKDRERSVGEIADILHLKHGTASANLNALAKASLVAPRREGTKIYYRITNQMVLKICEIACDCIHKEIDAMVKMQDGMEKF